METLFHSGSNSYRTHKGTRFCHPQGTLGFCFVTYVIYMKLLRDVIWSLGVQYHKYAGNTCYFSFRSNSRKAVPVQQSCTLPLGLPLSLDAQFLAVARNTFAELKLAHKHCPFLERSDLGTVTRVSCYVHTSKMSLHLLAFSISRKVTQSCHVTNIMWQELRPLCAVSPYLL